MSWSHLAGHTVAEIVFPCGPGRLAPVSRQLALGLTHFPIRPVVVGHMGPSLCDFSREATDPTGEAGRVGMSIEYLVVRLAQSRSDLPTAADFPGVAMFVAALRD